MFAAVTGVLIWGVFQTDASVITPRGEAAVSVDVVVKRGDRLFPLSKRSPVLLREKDALRVDIASAENAWVALGLLSEKRGRILVEGQTEKGTWRQPSSLILDAAKTREVLIVLVETDLKIWTEMKRDVERGIVPKGAYVWRYDKEPM